MANVEQMLKTYRRILDENLGISWKLLDENGLKWKNFWEKKNFEQDKNLGEKILSGNESALYISY